MTDEEITNLENIVAYAKRAIEIVHAMANLPLGYSHEAGNYCVICGADDGHGGSTGGVRHTPDCAVTKARALHDEG